MQADDAIPPREKERKEGEIEAKRGKKKRKIKPANSLETVSQRRILLAWPKLHKLFLKGLPELLSSPHCGQDWHQGVPDPSVPGAQSPP